VTRIAPILPGATLGVLGGGQLGRMFAMSAMQMGYRVAAFTNEPNSPISQICPQVTVGDYSDEAALRKFGKTVSVVTIEFENIPSSALEALQSETLVRPGPHVLHITQHRLREKQFLSSKNFPLAPFHAVNNAQDLKQALEKIGTPAVLKTAGFGYDGKGQKVIHSAADADAAYAAINGQEAIVEQYIDFDKEISVIGARSQSGDFVAYGPIENEHVNHILDVSFSPARINWTLAEEAIDLTRSIMDALDVVGLLCVEMFVTPEETLIVNELAPRPHNSGHYSIEGCPTSQFEQQVRTITGLPLGSSETERGSAMVNLLGDLWADGEPDWVCAVALPDVHLHLYGKGEPRPGRKMGHITACARWADEAVDRAKSARELVTRVKA
jgi:5-(carboxyamino)imidazole ribonucleotide synthase